jgi:hypothetical protein
MKKILLFSICLICIVNYLSAQTNADYRTFGSGNWNDPSRWEKFNNGIWVNSSDYPGQNPGAGEVTILASVNITLNVSPANPISSLTMGIGNASNSLTISDGFTLNVSGSIQFNPANGAGTITKSIVMNGPGAVLNCLNINMLAGDLDTKIQSLQFTGGGTINVSGTVTMSPVTPVRTQINFPGGGTLNVGTSLKDGTINLGTGTINLGGSLTLGTFNSGTGTINFNGGGTQQITGIVSFYNMGMTNAAATLQLLGNVTVTNTLTLTAGKIELGPSLMSLTNTTPANQLVGGNSSSYIYATGPGRLRRNGLTAGTHNFPVGTSANYLPVTIVPTALSDFAVNVFSPATTNGESGGPAFLDKTKIVDAVWNIDRPTGTGNAAITIQWANALEGVSFAGFSDSQIGISRFDGNTWLTPVATIANAAANRVTATFNTFSPFGIRQITNGVGDYQSVATGNWNNIATWQRYNGTAFVAATDYPGQNAGTGLVTITNGNTVTLNVSPANPIDSLLIQSGGANTGLSISNGFTLNVTFGVRISPPTSGAAIVKVIILNGAAAQLNCGSLTIIQGGNDNRVSGIEFVNGTVNVSGNMIMSLTQPQRTVVRFNPTGILNVGGNVTGGTIISNTGNSTLNVVGNLNAVTFNPGTTATTSVSGNMVSPIINPGAGTLNIAGNVNNPTISPTFTGTVNFNGNSVQEFIGDAIFPNMGMTNAASTLKLIGNVEVTGTLTLTAGKIELGPNLLGLTNAIPANQLVGGSSSSYVLGTQEFGRFVRQNLAAATAYNFPLGTPTNYMPVTVTPSDVSNFAVNAFSPAATDGEVGGPTFINKSRIVDAMWLIERPVGTGNSTITIQWADALEGSIFAAFGNAQIGISRNASGIWLPAIATSADAAANTVTAPFNAFTMFGVGEISVALPVTFGSFEAYEKQKGIQLDWKVYTEDKVKNYEVERSADAVTFTVIGSLPALYNHGSGGNYSFFDGDPLPGVSYYRIKNIDIDGKSAYSQVRMVNRDIFVKGLTLYPNPALNSFVLLQGNSLAGGIYKINISGINGQEIYRKTINHIGGTISQTIELPAKIGKGVYLVTIKDEKGNNIFSEKLIKK